MSRAPEHIVDERAIAVPPGLAGMRRFALDGALLLFDRDTGWNALLEGDETRALRMRAPRVVQFAITNHCNLACGFCSRDVGSASEWSVDGALAILRDLAAAGVLEVAFGGGEPLVFRGIAELIRRLYDETPLAVSLTTNGRRLDGAMLRAIAGRYGQIRLSLYDDDDWRARIALLAREGARFGINWLLTPERLDRLELDVLDAVASGARDVLVLSYNGRDPALHLSPEQARDAASRIALLAQALRGRATLKLDVCWGERMEGVPRLFTKDDCGAGREHIVITSDRRVMPCSFHHRSFAIDGAADVLRVWREEREALASAARDPGCARTPGHGLGGPLLPILSPRRDTG
jgi:MoaA/NifB/PqqE/SkfB family radical SAM enzyme